MFVGCNSFGSPDSRSAPISDASSLLTMLLLLIGLPTGVAFMIGYAFQIRDLMDRSP